LDDRDELLVDEDLDELEFTCSLPPPRRSLSVPKDVALPWLPILSEEDAERICEYSRLLYSGLDDDILSPP
jgi:hypothetical protein